MSNTDSASMGHRPKPSSHKHHKGHRTLIKRLITRMLRSVKKALDKKARSYPTRRRPSTSTSTKSFSSPSTTSQLPSRVWSRRTFSSSSIQIKRRFTAFRRWSRRRLATIREDSREAAIHIPEVDWDAVDDHALASEILKQNADAMREASRIAAETLRKESGWIREHEAFDDSAWVEREGVDNEGWETDEDDAVSPVVSRPVLEDRAVASTCARQRFNTLARKAVHRRSVSDRSIPSLQPCDSSPCSSIKTLPTPLLGAVQRLQGDNIQQGDDSSVRRHSSGHFVEPTIVITDWDEEMRIMEQASCNQSVIGMDEDTLESSSQTKVSRAKAVPGKARGRIDASRDRLPQKDRITGSTLSSPTAPIDSFIEHSLSFPLSC